MGGTDSERCGRCSMTAAVEATDPADDPFDGERIEVTESNVRAVARPAVWLGQARRWLDEMATRLIYGR